MAQQAVSRACRRRIFLFQVNERMNSWRPLIFLLFATVSAHDGCEEDRKILDTLKSENPTGFNTEHIPKPHGEDSLVVDTGLQINTIHTIPHTNKLNIDLRFIQKWTDSNLNFAQQNPCHNVINIGKHQESIWTPEEMFSNSENAKVHRKSAVLQISKNGSVTIQYRIHQDVPCRTHALDYPFGNTTCALIWRNDVSPRDAYLIKWDQALKDSFLQDPGFHEIGDLMYLGGEFSQEQVYLNNGVYDELTLNLHFHRGHKKIILLFFVPSVIFMVISWMSLCLGPMAITRSILLTMSLVLLMIHYSVNLAGLPETSGITAIDLWKVFSLLFVLGILIELICVTCMASVGRSRKLPRCCSGNKRGRYAMEPVYEELNDLRARNTRKTSKCCRYSALFFDFVSMWLFATVFILFVAFFYLSSSTAVKFFNNIKVEDLIDLNLI